MAAPHHARLPIGLGKSTVFGDWTFPVLVLIGLALWVGVARVLLRELR